MRTSSAQPVTARMSAACKVKRNGVNFAAGSVTASQIIFEKITIADQLKSTESTVRANGRRAKQLCRTAGEPATTRLRTAASPRRTTLRSLQKREL